MGSSIFLLLQVENDCHDQAISKEHVILWCEDRMHVMKSVKTLRQSSVNIEVSICQGKHSFIRYVVRKEAKSIEWLKLKIVPNRINFLTQFVKQFFTHFRVSSCILSDILLLRAFWIKTCVMNEWIMHNFKIQFPFADNNECLAE